MQSWVLELIRCPVTAESLQPCPEDVLAQLLAAQQRSELRNRIGRPPNGEFQSGLINRSATLFYPISNGIPTLIGDESIELPVVAPK